MLKDILENSVPSLLQVTSSSCSSRERQRASARPRAYRTRSTGAIGRRVTQRHPEYDGRGTLPARHVSAPAICPKIGFSSNRRDPAPAPSPPVSVASMRWMHRPGPLSRLIGIGARRPRRAVFRSSDRRLAPRQEDAMPLNRRALCGGSAAASAQLGARSPEIRGVRIVDHIAMEVCTLTWSPHLGGRQSVPEAGCDHVWRLLGGFGGALGGTTALAAPISWLLMRLRASGTNASLIRPSPATAPVCSQRQIVWARRANACVRHRLPAARSREFDSPNSPRRPPPDRCAPAVSSLFPYEWRVRRLRPFCRAPSARASSGCSVSKRHCRRRRDRRSKLCAASAMTLVEPQGLPASGAKSRLSSAANVRLPRAVARWPRVSSCAHRARCTSA